MEQEIQRAGQKCLGRKREGCISGQMLGCPVLQAETSVNKGEDIENLHLEYRWVYKVSITA